LNLPNLVYPDFLAAQCYLEYPALLLHLSGLVNPAFLEYPENQHRQRYFENLGYPDFPAGLLLRLGLVNLVCLESLVFREGRELLMQNLAFPEYLAHPSLLSGRGFPEFLAYLDFLEGLSPLLEQVQCFANPESPDCLVRQ
jgi:hypothetical protein